MTDLDEEKINKTYESLVDLTRKTEDNLLYFSANRVYWHGSGDSYEEGMWNEVDEPSRKENESFLEVLVDRGKAIKLRGEMSPYHTKNITFYRAILKE